VSNLPIKLFPGVRIGQIIFDQTTSPSNYKGKDRKYVYPIGPESTKIKRDNDSQFFVNFQQAGFR
jgi:deoxycytidine triphosphate deaminase